MGAVIGPSSDLSRLSRIPFLSLLHGANHFFQTSAMSALLETSLGDIVIDLLVDDAPKACDK